VGRFKRRTRMGGPKSGETWELRAGSRPKKVSWQGELEKMWSDVRSGLVLQVIKGEGIGMATLTHPRSFPLDETPGEIAGYRKRVLAAISVAQSQAVLDLGIARRRIQGDGILYLITGESPKFNWYLVGELLDECRAAPSSAATSWVSSLADEASRLEDKEKFFCMVQIEKGVEIVLLASREYVSGDANVRIGHQTFV